MKIKLGRKETIILNFTGRTYCGCRYFQAALFEPCDQHLGRMVLRVGKHRTEDD